MLLAARRALMTATVLGFGVLGGGGREAAADEAQQPGSGPSCVLQGSAIVQKDLAIYGAASGGNKIAQFSGAVVPLKATNFPADASTGRAQINTGGGFRVEGFVDAKSLPVVTSRDIPVAPGHVWISGGRTVRLTGASPGQLRVELPAQGAVAQPVRATAPCDGFGFDHGPAPIFEVPGSARGLVAQHGDIDLSGSASGDVVYTLHASGDGGGLLLWGLETRGAYAHVVARFELFVDGWVRRSDVRALPRGEMMDQLAPPERVQNPPALALKDYQRIVRTNANVVIRYGRAENTPPIGEIEQGTEVYVNEIVLGWAAVLPKALHVMPADDRSFWVKASDLGLAVPDAGARKR